MRREEPGISTLISVIMLTAMIVVATGSVAFILPNFTPPSPPLNASFRVSVYQDAIEEVIVQLDHQGGESVDPSSLRVMLSGRDAGGEKLWDTQSGHYEMEGSQDRMKMGDTLRFIFQSDGLLQGLATATVVYLPAKQVLFGSPVLAFNYILFGTLTTMLTDPPLENEVKPWSPRLGENEYPRFNGHNFRQILVSLSIELQGQRVGWYRVMDRQTFDLVELMRVMDNQDLTLPIDTYDSIRIIVHTISVELDDNSTPPVSIVEGQVELPMLLNFNTAIHHDLRVDIDGPASLMISPEGDFIWKTKAMVAHRSHAVETWDGVAITGDEDEGPEPTPFTFSPLAPVAGESIQFTYQPEDWENVVSWSWDFGDGATSFVLNPTHQYGSMGVYDVKLTRVHENGSTSEIIWPVGVSHPAPAVVEDDVPMPLPLNESAGVSPPTGSAVVQVPITVPPGRGVTPSLSLNYQSSPLNSWVGVGWGLNLGFVQRSTKYGVSNYDGSDEFVLVTGSAYELVNIGENEYRAKIDSSFMRIRFDGSSWEVWTKDGTKHIFGSSANSRQANERGVFKWCLDRVVDTHGNYMTISHVENQGQIYPSRIEYTGNEVTGELPWASVNFVLEDRTDASPSYHTGSQVVTANRLAAIETKVESQLARRYLFGYRYSAVTGRSLLTSITEYGSDGASWLPQRTFTYYQTMATPNGQTITESAGSSVSPVMGDFNGDGMTDIGWVDGDGNWTIGISNGSDFTTSTWLSNFKLSDLSAFVSGDFNRDGRSDVGGYNKNTGQWQIVFSQGNSFASPVVWSAGVGVEEETSDWRTFVNVGAPWYVCTDDRDYFRIYKNGDWRYWIVSGAPPYGLYNSGTGGYVTEGTNFSPMVKYNDFPDPSQTEDIRVVPFDPSNRTPTDGVYITAHTSDYIEIYMGDTGAVGRAVYRLRIEYKLRSRSPVVSGDFNGDGLTDIAVGPKEPIPAEQTGQTGQTVTLFSDDFNDGNYNGWEVSAGSWWVESGMLKGRGSGGGVDGWIYAGDTSWTDYEFSVKITFDTNNAELVFRSIGHWQSEYRLEVWREYNKSPRIDLIRYKNGVGITLVDITSPVQITNPSIVKVNVSGNNIKVYVNDTLVIDFHDMNPLSNGRIGLGVIWDWYARFDDVTVVGPPTLNITGGDHGGQDWIISSNTEIAGVHENIGTFRINSGVTVSVKAWDGSKYGSVEIHANTIDIQGALSADGAGYRGGSSGSGEPGRPGEGSGAGGAPSGASGGGGGGYGGSGGRGAGSAGGSGGSTYGRSGLVTSPPSSDDIQMGSGGGSGSSAQGGQYGAGGNGGGSVLLFAYGNIDISGTVSANGGDGGYGAPRGTGGAGGGSGGGILLHGSNISVSGSLRAKGGRGGNSMESEGGGGGAGGRIKIFYQTLGTANSDVSGGAGGQRNDGQSPGSPGQSGTYSAASHEPPTSEPTTPSAENWWVALSDGTKFNLSGAWISGFASSGYSFMGGDFNGDGLADLGAFDRDTGNWYVALSNGSRFIDAGQWISGFGADKTLMAGDFNGDGMTDAGWVDESSGEWHIAVSDGTKFNSPQTWLTSFGGRPTLGDFNGDGLLDPAIFKSNEMNVRFSTGEPIDLLYRFSNGAGGVTSFDYSPFTQLGLPSSVQVVSSMTQEDGLGNSYVTGYSYDNAAFDFDNREFRGFGYVRVTGADGGFSETWFMQDGIYRGNSYRQEVKDNNGVLFARKEFTFSYSEPYAGVKVPYLVQEDSYTYDGENKHTRISYTYDGYGNVLETVYHGDVTVADDGYTEHSEYVYNREKWIMGLLSHSWTTDARGTKLSEAWYYYDNNDAYTSPPTKGDLTRKVRWLDTGPDVETTTEYDIYGNLVSSTDALGHTATMEYDSYHHLFVSRITNSLGHITSMIYDSKTGQLLSKTNANGYTTSYEYDSLGRLTKIISPLDISDYPTKSYSYYLDTVPVRTTVYTRSIVGSTDIATTRVFFDGFGKVAQIKSPAENLGQQIVDGMAAYDKSGREVARWFPYFVDASDEYVQPDPSKPKTMREYDGIGRVTAVTTPDGGSVTTTYYGWATTSTDANGNMIRTTHDAFGRTVKVEEFNGREAYTTTYSYDALDRLVRVVDASGNTTTFSHDSLGRQVALNDPDIGEWIYDYDAAGNITREQNTKGESVNLFYDELNRLVRKEYSSGENLKYEYDNSTVANSIGRLTCAPDSTQFYYDELGREIKSVREIDGVEYTVEKTFDLAGRLRSVRYPDNELIVYVYNRAGLTEAVVGNTTYIRMVDYDAAGRKTFVEYGNGVYTNYIYDSSGRLQSVRTNDGALQDLSYEYDAAGNIIRMEDQARSTIKTFAYDNINRLVEATGPYGTKTYVYDPIGNLTEKDGVRYVYGQDGRMPHAVTSGSNGFRAVYDANGRMTLRENNNGTTEYEWDYDGNLTRAIRDNQVIAEFVYDDMNGRIKKITPEENTLYINRFYEERGGDVYKYIFLANDRVASIHGGKVNYLHSDHLGSTSFVTGQDGDLTQLIEYDPFGSVVMTSSSGDEVYKYMGKEFDDETGLIYFGARYYDPKLGRFISPDPLITQTKDPQTWNRYAFVRNNPIMHFEVQGNFWLVAAIIGAVVGAVSAYVSGGNVLAGAAFGFLAGAASGWLASSVGYAIGAASPTPGIISTFRAAMIGGMEFGISGFGIGMAAGFAGGRGSFRDTLSAGLRGFASGFVVGAVAGATYKLGWQSIIRPNPIDVRNSGEIIKAQVQRLIEQGKLAEAMKMAADFVNNYEFAISDEWMSKLKLLHDPEFFETHAASKSYGYYEAIYNKQAEMLGGAIHLSDRAFEMGAGKVISTMYHEMFHYYQDITGWGLEYVGWLQKIGAGYNQIYLGEVAAHYKTWLFAVSEGYSREIQLHSWAMYRLHESLNQQISGTYFVTPNADAYFWTNYFK